MLYVHHQSFDYNGNVVTQGLPHPFVESLTHDSIIVQIPRLHGQINNRLDKVLSIFDQSYKDIDDNHVLQLDDAIYNDDDDMQHILRRLLMASSDSDVRQDMNVEDEYFSVIEKRDTEIMMRDKKLAEQKVQLTEQKAQLTEQKAQLTEQKALLRSSIQLMQHNGLSLETIAANLGKDMDELVQIMEE